MQPTYTKQDPQPQWEYRHMSWEIFLTLREWAQEVANADGNPVYLVGSALWKPYPRDIDISIIMPLLDFEKRYGVIPDNEEELKKYTARSEYWHSWSNYKMVLEHRIRYAFRCDVKIQPDAWFSEKDKLLLATPGGNVRTWGWGEVKNLGGCTNEGTDN